MPGAQFYCSGCVLERALGITWMPLACHVLHWFTGKVFLMKRCYRSSTKHNPKTNFQRTQNMYKGQGVAACAGWYLFYWFYPTRPLLQWVTLMPLLEWLTEVMSLGCSCPDWSAGGILWSNQACRSTEPRLLLSNYWSTSEKFPFTGSTVQWSHREFPMVCHRLGIEVKLFKQCGCKTFSRVKYKNLLWESSGSSGFDLRNEMFWYKTWGHCRLWFKMSHGTGISIRRKKERTKPPQLQKLVVELV